MPDTAPVDAAGWQWSKKFVAWLLASILWLIILGSLHALMWKAIVVGDRTAVLSITGLIFFAMAITGGITLYYQAGQVGLDKVVQLTQIAADTERTLVIGAKGTFTLHAKGDAPKDAPDGALPT